MANKNKILAQVQRHIQKGNWDKAIKELQRIVQDDPSDVRTLLKLGDVHAKKGDHEAASQVYRQVAESYSDQGFFLKAVAVYKQILKYDQHHLDVVLRLAELYEHLGLTSEAMSQYQRAAEIHDHKGEREASLDVIRRMVELDPENVALRIKLAEAISSAGRTADAAAEFERAAEILRSQNRIDDYLKVAERLVFHDPNRPDVLKELARLYMNRGDPKRALTKLQMCFKADEKDVETLTLLAQAFSDLGQVQKTRYVYQELVRQYEERGQLREAAEVRRALQQLDPGPDEPSPNASQTLAPSATGAYPLPTPPNEPTDAAKAELQEALNYGLDALPFFQEAAPPPSPPPPPRLPTSSPGPVPPRMPPPVTPQPFPDAQPVQEADAVGPHQTPPPSPPPGGANIEKLLSEADVYLKYGLQQKALDHLRGAFSVDPDSVEAYTKMRDIYVSMGDHARAAEAVASILHIHTQRMDEAAVEATRADLAQLAPRHPLAGGPMEDMEGLDENISIDITEDGHDALTGGHDALTGSHDELDLSFEAPIEASGDLDGAIEYGDDDDDEEVFILDDPSVESVSAPSTPSPRAIVYDDEELTLGGDDEAMVVGGGGMASGDLTAQAFDANFQTANLPKIPSEPVPAAIELPTPAQANDAVGMLAPSQPVSAPHLPVEPEPAPPPPPPPEPTPPPPTPEPAPPPPAPEPPVAAADDEDVSDELDEIDFLLEAKLYEEAESALQDILARAPGHPRATALLASIQSRDSDNMSMDLMGGLSETPASDPMSAEDHYDQGMLFKELGRLDDAIRELERASHSGDRAAGALEMLGMCYLEKSEPEHAIQFFTQALERVPDGPAATNLKYELGAAHELTQNPTEALSWFEACAAADGGHRDVQARLQRLIQSSGAELPTPGAGSETPQKISYL